LDDDRPFVISFVRFFIQTMKDHSGALKLLKKQDAEQDLIVFNAYKNQPRKSSYKDVVRSPPRVRTKSPEIVPRVESENNEQHIVIEAEEHVLQPEPGTLSKDTQVYLLWEYDAFFYEVSRTCDEN
jgi:hypothetical protein